MPGLSIGGGGGSDVANVDAVNADVDDADDADDADGDGDDDDDDGDGGGGERESCPEGSNGRGDASDGRRPNGSLMMTKSAKGSHFIGFRPVRAGRMGAGSDLAGIGSGRPS